jgi:hypothetical protein
VASTLLDQRHVSEEPLAAVALLEACRLKRLVVDQGFRTTLTGLDGVHVHVEPVNIDAERDGFTRSAVRDDVESALRSAGLEVYSKTGLFDTPGTPLLHVDVMTLRLDGRYAYSVRLELWQRVRLVREPRVAALALTWGAPQLVGTVAVERLAELRDAVRSAVAGFIEECRKATAEAME